MNSDAKKKISRLPKTLSSWGMPSFSETLKRELAQFNADQLPLQQGLSTSSVALDGKREVMIISVKEEPSLIRIKAGVFYSGIIAGCSCADDPTPVEENSEYCEIELEIDKKTAETRVTLLGD